jgi:hypothetical protein
MLDMYMPTPIDQPYKTKMCAELTVLVAKAIKAGEFPADQLSPVCTELIALLETPQTQEEFLSMLTKLTATWQIFSPTLAQVQKQFSAAGGVEKMFNRGNTPIAT